MKILQEPKSAVLKLIKPNTSVLPPYRKYNFCDERKTGKGIILFNFLTSEFTLLEQSDFISETIPDSFDIALTTPECAQYLLAHRFIVNETNADCRDIDDLRFIMRLKDQLDFKGYSSYTILTTTDCNARCFYCYEQGIRKIPMSDETAADVADYILKTRDTSAENVHLSWFGGEPLYNAKAIDIICQKLTDAGVKYKSSMISNGLLLDKATIEKAVNFWKLTNAQITLDGTRETYNETKAYIGNVTNAYDTVLNNIAMALDAGIRISIRLNVGESNVDDLDKLADELASRFPDKKPDVYSHLLFQYDDEQLLSAKDILQEKNTQLMAKLLRLGLAGNRELSDAKSTHGIRIFSCMADNPTSVVIMPDGRLHSCEHITANFTWGSINTGEKKTDKPDDGISPLEYWSECLVLDECRNCMIYPFCLKLKHCPAGLPTCDKTNKESILQAVNIIETKFVNQLET